MKARLILIILLFLLVQFLPISTFAQHRPSDDDFIIPDSLAQIYDSLAAARARIDADSMRLDSLREVLGDSIQENTTNLDNAEGLSLDLDDYDRNVVHLWGVNVYPLIGNFSAGLHGDSTSNFKTDAQSIGVYIPASGSSDGIVFPWPHADWGHWTDKDTMIPSETYFSIAIRYDSTSLARLHTDGLGINVGKVSAYYSTTVAKASFSIGWNYISVLLDPVFTVGAGSPSWGAIDSCWIFNVSANSADGGSIFLVENPHLVRKDAGAAKPNWAQTETNGTWANDWSVTGTVWLVNESGRLSILCPGNTAGVGSYLSSARTWEDYEVSGISKLNSAGTGWFWFWANATNRDIMQIAGNTLSMHGSSGSTTVAFDGAAYEQVPWRLSRKGATVTGSLSHDGINWISGTVINGTTGAQTTRIGVYHPGRMYDLAFSTVEKAHYATVSGGFSTPLGNIGKWHAGIGVLELYINADSSYFTPGDTVKAR